MNRDPLLHVIENGKFTSARFARPTSLTGDNADDISREFAALVAGKDQPDLSLDLGGVEFVGSMALTKLIGLNRKVRAAGGRLTLINLRPVVRRVFTVTRLDRVLHIGEAADTLSP
jgi:anti-sigma B factor antagonist